jgi:AcrR family transcriptional regulator
MPTRTSSNRTRPAAAAPPALRGDVWKKSRRIELLDAADRAIRRAGPRVSMDDVAAEAGISRVVLYRYFGDKSGLYQALAERYTAELMVEVRNALRRTTDPKRRLRRTIDTYVRFIEDHEELYDFLMHRMVREGRGAQTTVAAFMRNVAEEVGEILSENMLALGFDPAPASVWSNGVVGMVHLATDSWLQKRDVSRQRFVDYLEGLLSYGFFGLAADPALARESGLRPIGSAK